ncbi:MAG: DUF2721 domain-containing protein [Gemmataceae bacterium]|nr:DUF2721 domain-containing protein [Gemmataceae bacterium]
MTLPDIDLPKVAGAAASAVGLIIASTILVSFVSTRYTSALERYTDLTDGFRGYQDRNKRREALREQVRQYRRRLRLLSWASELLCWVMICAVVTVVAAGVSMVFPGHRGLDLAGAFTLLLTLSLDVVAIGLVVAETRIDRRAVEAEAMDLDEVFGRPEPAPQTGSPQPTPAGS